MLIKNYIKILNIACTAFLLHNNSYCMDNSLNESSSSFNILSESLIDVSAAQPVKTSIINNNKQNNIINYQNVVKENGKLKEQNITLQKAIGNDKKQLTAVNKTKVLKNRFNQLNNQNRNMPSIQRVMNPKSNSLTAANKTKVLNNQSKQLENQYVNSNIDLADIPYLFNIIRSPGSIGIKRIKYLSDFIEIYSI